MKQNGNGARRPDEILAEIERTRHHMDSTLTQIEHRFTPGQLLDQGLDYLKGSGAKDFANNLGGQVKNNPLPVALVGLGLAWLMASSKRPPEFSTSTAGPSLGERAGEMRNRVAGVADSAKSKLTGAGEKLSSARQATRQRMSELGDSARQQVERAKGGLDYMVREQPLALGAIGLALGAVIAAAMPRTRKEDELMGETRDQLLDQAKEAGQEKLEQAKDVAKEAMSTASSEAESRGLKPKSKSGKTDSGETPEWSSASAGGSAGGTRNLP